MGIQEFSDCYKLGYHFKKEDYQEAPCLLAKDGFLVAKTVDNAGILIFYVPEFISDNQCMWYNENIHLFSKYSTVISLNLILYFFCEYLLNINKISS